MSKIDLFKNKDRYSISESFSVASVWFDKNTFYAYKKKSVAALAGPAGYVLMFSDLIIHAIWANQSRCSTNFQRAGADISLIAAVIFAFVSWYSLEGLVLDGGKVPKASILNPNIALAIVALVGTLVWGYGDMITLFGSCTSPSN